MSAGEQLLSSPEATEQLAAEVVARLSAGDIVLLSGELGAGKTTFVRAAVSALGSDAEVTSPTFAIAHRYDTPEGVVGHLDLYRLSEQPPNGVDDELIDEALPEEAIGFVEWPERLPSWLAQRVVLEVDLAHEDQQSRRARLTWHR